MNKTHPRWVDNIPTDLTPGSISASRRDANGRMDDEVQEIIHLYDNSTKNNDNRKHEISESKDDSVAPHNWNLTFNEFFSLNTFFLRVICSSTMI